MARVWETKSNEIFWFDLIGNTSIGLSLYIYRPEKTYPFTSRITWGLFTKKTLILLGLYKPDRSDRSARPVRPVDLSRCQIWLSTVTLKELNINVVEDNFLYTFRVEHFLWFGLEPISICLRKFAVLLINVWNSAESELRALWSPKFIIEDEKFPTLML